MGYYYYQRIKIKVLSYIQDIIRYKKEYDARPYNSVAHYNN